MKQMRHMDEVWKQFIIFLEADAPQTVKQIRPATSAEAIAEAGQRLQIASPEELRQLYLLADGFAAGAFLLRDDYRILPLAEMVEASLALVGQTVILDNLAGEVEQSQKVIRLLFAHAKAEDPDVSQVSLQLRTKHPSVEMWFLEGGIHDWEEVVETGEGLAEWLDGCLEYYR